MVDTTLNTIASMMNDTSNLMGWLHTNVPLHPDEHQASPELEWKNKQKLPCSAYTPSRPQTPQTPQTSRSGWSSMLLIERRHGDGQSIWELANQSTMLESLMSHASRVDDDGTTSPRLDAAVARQERKSQQKNKVLMLLELEQVLSIRSAAKERRHRLRPEILAEVQTRESRRESLYEALEELEQRRNMYHPRDVDNPILDLEEYYEKFDACMAELRDRDDCIELEAFKQLVIGELEERADALRLSQERLKLVHGQLMQMFIVDELIEEGLYHGSTMKKQHPQPDISGWVDVTETEYSDFEEGDMDWVMFD